MSRDGLRRRPTPRHRVEYAAFRLVRGVLRALPERSALRLGGALGWVAGTVLRIRRRAVDRHLEIAFPDRPAPWRAKVARGCYVHLGRESVATLLLSNLDARDVVARTTVEGLEPVREAVEDGRGAVVVTGHLGNWEIGGAAVAARGIPVDAVAVGQANPLFDRDLVAARSRLGMNVVKKTRAPRGVLRSLSEGRVSALVADQNPIRGWILVDFFGKEAPTARGPALLALRSGAPLFLGVALREPGWPQRYRLVLERVETETTGERDRDVRRLVQAYTARLEAWIAGAPEQYFWQHRRWKSRPRRRG